MYSYISNVYFYIKYILKTHTQIYLLLCLVIYFIYDQIEASVEENDTAHNATGESDMLEDQIDDLGELDSHAVEMIVVGPNQSGVSYFFLSFNYGFSFS